MQSNIESALSWRIHKMLKVKPRAKRMQLLLGEKRKVIFGRKKLRPPFVYKTQEQGHEFRRKGTINKYEPTFILYI